jgi:hypothetical protein
VNLILFDIQALGSGQNLSFFVELAKCCRSFIFLLSATGTVADVLRVMDAAIPGLDVFGPHNVRCSNLDPSLYLDFICNLLASLPRTGPALIFVGPGQVNMSDPRLGSTTNNMFMVETDSMQVSWWQNWLSTFTSTDGETKILLIAGFIFTPVFQAS